MTTTIDPAALAARVAAATQPSADQALLAELWTDLQQAMADLAAAVAGQGDAQVVADLRAQVLDLTGKLQAANAALSADQQQLAATMAADKTTIDALTAAKQVLATANATLTADKATLAAQLATAQAQTAAAQQSVTNLTAQLQSQNSTIQSLTASNINLNDQITALKQQISVLSVNHPPIWQTVPPLNFQFGVAKRISIAQFVTDPDKDPLTIRMAVNHLQPGVTLDPVTKEIVYDGIGAAGSSTGNVLNADDGKTP